MPNPVLAARGLTKIYGPVVAVDHADLDIHPGTIHAILGENGAGKSTLIGMLSGATAPTAGTILLDGNPIALTSVRTAQSAGIATLPQEASLVPTLTAAENIVLGLPHHSVLASRRAAQSFARELLAGLGQTIDLTIPAGELPPVQQTMVALARALARDARVLILDEPTAALSDTEITQLFATLRTLRDHGVAIIYISHRLSEVFGLADTITVMRNGQVVWTRPALDTDRAATIAAMIGRSVQGYFPARQPVSRSDEVLVASGLHGEGVHGVDLTLHAGRILGIAGLAGAGRSELLALLAGASRAAAGQIWLDGRDITGTGLRARLRAGIALVPEERRAQGLVLHQSITDNIVLTIPRATSRAGITSRRRATQLAHAAASEYGVRTVGPHQPVAELSGGNQQKVVLAKFLGTNPRVLLLDEPTRGIDIGAKVEIYHLIRRLAADGMAVVVVSSEISELLGLADEVAVMAGGRITGVVDAASANEHDVLALCYQEAS